MFSHIFSWIFSVSAIAASLAASHAQHQQSNSKYSIASLTANSSVKDEFSRYHRPQQLPHQQPTVSFVFGIFVFWLFLAFFENLGYFVDNTITPFFDFTHPLPLLAYNLFMTSKNPHQFTNSPIHEFEVVQKPFKMKRQGSKCFLK